MIENLCLICRKVWTANLNGCCTKCTKKFNLLEEPKVTPHETPKPEPPKEDNNEEF